jgi:hypothetical protein
MPFDDLLNLSNPGFNGLERRTYLDMQMGRIEPLSAPHFKAVLADLVIPIIQLSVEVDGVSEEMSFRINTF